MTQADVVGRRLAVLGAADVVAGLVLARGGSAGVRAFGRQTAMWGAIDLAIAGVFAARRGRPADPARLRRVLLVNAGLDVGYVAAGGHVVARTPTLGGRLPAAEGRGHGAAVVVQGLALLAFDLWHARAVTTGQRSLVASPP